MELTFQTGVNSAHRFLVAAMIRFLPAALSFRFFLTGLTGACCAFFNAAHASHYSDASPRHPEILLSPLRS
jgi:hypothetical protein